MLTSKIIHIQPRNGPPSPPFLKAIQTIWNSGERSHEELLPNQGKLVFLLTKDKDKDKDKEYAFFYEVTYVAANKSEYCFNDKFRVDDFSNPATNKPSVFANQTAVYIYYHCRLFYFNLKNQESITYKIRGYLNHLADGSKIGFIETDTRNQNNQHVRLMHLSPSLEMRIFEELMSAPNCPIRVTTTPNGRFLFLHQVEIIYTNGFLKYGPYQEKLMCFDLTTPSATERDTTQKNTRPARNFLTNLGHVKSITCTHDGKYIFYVNGFYNGWSDSNWLNIIETDPTNINGYHHRSKIYLGVCHGVPALLLTNNDRVCIVHTQENIVFIDVSIKNIPYLYSRIPHPDGFRSATLMKLLPDEKHLIVGINKDSSRHFNRGYKSNFSIYKAALNDSKSQERTLFNGKDKKHNRHISLMLDEVICSKESYLGSINELPKIPPLFSHNDSESGYIVSLHITPDSNYMIIQNLHPSSYSDSSKAIKTTAWDISNLEHPNIIRNQLSNNKSDCQTMTHDWRFIGRNGSSIVSLCEMDSVYKNYIQSIGDMLSTTAKMPRELIALTMSYGFFKPYPLTSHSVTKEELKPAPATSQNIARLAV